MCYISFFLKSVTSLYIETAHVINSKHFVVLSLKVDFVIMANTADSGEISPL